MWGPLTISMSTETAWQVGAWADAATAASVAGRLQTGVGEGARVWQERTDAGLVRVRVRWPQGAPSDVVARLEAAGFDQLMSVTGPRTVRIAGATKAVTGIGDIDLTPAGDWPTVVGARRYRGRFELRISGDRLLVVNVLELEDYLRGVVPVEMGPYQFPELEALKAQAVAARTYAVSHLGDHADEGYDICATPACQAYHGAGAEHVLTDRAVRETAGIIATFDGRPIDAMYTSTCGGHTEDAAEVFSDRAQPYLKGVACAWDRPLVLIGEPGVGRIGDSSEFRRWLALTAVELPGRPPDPMSLLPAVARICDGEVRQVAAKPDLERWIGALFAASGLDPTSPLVGGEGVERLTRLADLFGVPLSAATPEGWDRGWHLEAAAAALELQGAIDVDTGEAVPHPSGVAIYPRRANASEPLTPPLPLLWRWGDHYGGATRIEVVPGTTIERFRFGDRILALVVVESAGGGEADRRSAWRSWSRERTWEELARRLGVADLRDLEIARRSSSGRAVELSVVDGNGRRRLIEGFEIRRVLDLPETLFQMHATTLADGSRVVRFLGRGWGHGVGLCQNGAYGLARSGMGFEAILKHYYTGITVNEWNLD
jgi:stage II sporulation protein D